MDYTTTGLAEPKELFPKLPALADRLGVKPGDHGGGLMLGTYDVFALINAFLDHVDVAASRIEQEKPKEPPPPADELGVTYWR